MSGTKAVRIIVQWLLIPIAMAALGFFFIGPRVGENPELEAKAEAVQDLVKNSAPVEPEVNINNVPEPEPEKFSGLDIKVLKPGEKSEEEEENNEPEETVEDDDSSNEESSDDTPPDETSDDVDDLIPVTPPANTDGL